MVDWEEFASRDRTKLQRAHPDVQAKMEKVIERFRITFTVNQTSIVVSSQVAQAPNMGVGTIG